MPVMVEPKMMSCPSCGRETIVLCHGACGQSATHCPKCAKAPERKMHAYLTRR